MLITINLLPPEQRNKKTEIKKGEKIFTLSFTILACTVALSILLFTYNTTIKQQLNTINSQISSENSRLNDYKGLRTSLNNMSNTLIYIDTIEKKSINLESFLTQFSSIIPEKAQVTSLEISALPSPTIDISGKAESRTEVIKLFEKMKTSPFFSEPEIKSLDKSVDKDVASFQFSISAKILLEKL
ncbi:MAG: PilN domain-containing protein [bacterium]|nr:PilN domain-containing protein [bacterium]